MKLRSLAGGILLAGILSVPAFSQNAADPQGPAGGRRRGGAQSGEGFRGRLTPDQQMERLNKELTLSQDQQDKIRKLITDHQQQMREQMQKTRGENRDKIRDLRRQLEDARTAGDKEKVKTLEGQMQELTGESQRAAAEKKLMSDIEAVLTADQKTKFQQVKDSIFGWGALLEERPEMLLRAIESLKLPQEKMQKIKGIIDEWSTKAKASTAGGADRAAAAEAARKGAAEVYKKVMAELTPEEQAKVKAWRPGPGDWRGRGEGAGAGGTGRQGRRGAGRGAANAPGEAQQPEK